MNRKSHDASDGIEAIRFDDQGLHLLDQRLLPAQEHWLTLNSSDAVATAIADLVVRGAPAIGITAAYGCVIAARHRKQDQTGWQSDLDRIEQARPTAVNLMWAIRRMRNLVKATHRLDPERLETEAHAIHDEDIAANRIMANFGSTLIEPESGVLTHCNTGSLATGGIGTALGVIVAGYHKGRITRIFADETRPWLQGSRLTAWELAQQRVPFRVIVEGAAATLMASGQIQWVITGADRIAANGDVANKIGTCSLAVIARHFGVKVMVVAPTSTVDAQIASGESIAIEQRGPGEIWKAAGLDQIPQGFDAFNPVFDITPAELIDCIVTEQGVHYPPYAFEP